MGLLGLFQWIKSDDLHGGPYVNEEPDGSYSLTYYGRPKGHVCIILSAAEFEELKKAVADPIPWRSKEREDWKARR